MDDTWLKMVRCEERAAYYQAGHAIVALSEALEVVRLYIEPDGSSWIDVRFPDLSQSRLSRSVRARLDAKSVIQTLLAGPAAKLRYRFGTPYPDAPLQEFDLLMPDMMESQAIWRAICLAGQISEDSPSLIRCLWRRVSRQIHQGATWAAIKAVANALLINGELAGCEVRAIVRTATNP